MNVLRSQPNLQVVIFVPHFKLNEYKKEFFGKNIIFESIKDLPPFDSLFDKFFNHLSLFYIDTSSLRFFRKKHLLLERKQIIRYAMSMFFLLLFGNIKFLRNISRFFDYILVKETYFGKFFEKYKPDLVFAPNVISRIDRAFLRQAKKRKVNNVGMINAWDNITLGKYPFRILPDKLVVYNEIIRNEAIKYLDMPEKDIFISGWPHFDHYVNSKRISRDEFCKKVSINPFKRIILFASNAGSGPTEWQVLAMLDEAITKGDLIKNIIVLVRHHPVGEMIRGDAEYSNNIIFDDSKTIIQKCEKSYSEILKDDMDHLADTLFHSNVTISTCSTMSIDASAFDKPIVNIAFDGWEKKPFHQSIARAYTPHHMHYQRIMKTRGVKIAYSFPEMVDLINQYLENPSLDKEGRKRIVDEQCYKLDGQSGKRIGEYLLSCAGL